MIIFNGQFKGLSDSPYAGVEESFAKCIGIDGHSTPGLLKVAQKMVKDSDIVDELCEVSVAASNGYTFWFSSESGKIWARSSAGVWSLAYTTSPSTGTSYCLGAEEYDGFIYWATEAALHRIAIADADDSWTSVEDDWASFAETDEDFHPMIIQNSDLLIGDGRTIAKVSNATGSHVFTDNVKRINAPLKIKTFIDFDIDVLIGTFVSGVHKAQVLRWDTESDAISTSDPIDEDGVNAFTRDGNLVYVQCGSVGSIYLYDGQQLKPFKKIPGDYLSKTASVNPNATGNYMSIPIFGLSNVSGNPTEQGLYRLGSYSSSYPKALDLTYPLSSGMEGIEIGTLLVSNGVLFASWTDGTLSGVDAISESKYESAYIETPFLATADNRSGLKQIKEMVVNYASPVTGVAFSYKKNNETSFTDLLSLTDTDLSQEKSQTGVADVANFQGRIDFIVQGNDGPEIDSILINENV